jgi:hypothetical protein
MKVLHLFHEVLQNQILLKTDILDMQIRRIQLQAFTEPGFGYGVVLRNSDSIWILVQPRSSPEFLDNSFKIFTAENKF